VLNITVTRRVVVRGLIAIGAIALALPGTAAPASAGQHLPAETGCHPAALAQPVPPRVALPLATPVGQGTCPGVRPGAMVMFSGGLCTFNFVFRGSDRRTYIGTAGHCPNNAIEGEHQWKDDRGPGATDIKGRSIGHFVYSGFKVGNLEPTLDFALIRLNPGVQWSAQMCHFGGPDGMYTRHEPTPQVLQFFGNSPAYRDALPARSALAPNTMDATAVQAIGIAAHGDSGSGVIDQAGEAVGVLSLGIAPAELPNGALVGAVIVFSRLDVGIARAQRVLHLKLSIVSAPVL